jgi:hypothetical protein
MKALRKRVKEFQSIKSRKTQAWPQDIRDAVTSLARRVGDITASERSGVPRNTVTYWTDQAGLPRESQERKTIKRDKCKEAIANLLPSADLPKAFKPATTKVKAVKAKPVEVCEIPKGAKITFGNGASISYEKLVKARQKGLSLSLGQIEEAMSLLGRTKRRCRTRK